MKATRTETIKKYGSEIDRIVRVIRKWITEADSPPSDEDILTKCEDEFFASEISLSTGSHETVIFIDSLRKRLTSRYGILADLLEDPLINEIMVNGPERIYVEREKILVRVDDAFTSCHELEEMIRMFASDVHREINEANPIVDARLPSGFRVNGVLKNVALNGPILTIRKFREKEIEMDELVGCASLSKECAEDLAALVRSGYNIFISGGTSSGKTTFLNALTAYIGPSERVITIEDSAELVISHIENKVQMECRAANSIGNGLVNSVYLSGNGPLVEVLTDALHSKAFVKDLHTVVNEFLQHKAKDFQKNIIVFDEGQRAWDVGQMAAKGKSQDESEPDVMVRLCEERLDWCVLLILVGEGQEIYKGENSGISQWNTALNKGSKNWKIVCPDKLKYVFEADQDVLDYDEAAALDLTVSLRTHLAGDVSDFANALIDGDIDKAKSYVDSIYEEGFSMAITQNLDAAKAYCLQRYGEDPDARYGMIASSKGRDLPQFGVDNSFYGAINRGKYGRWFNTSRGSGYSCCDLNSVVTEFGIQGLELDMPIVCWDRDMAWNGTGWNKFKPKEDDSSDNNVYRVNSYRVLLTRGRDGFIIFLPPTEQLVKTYEMMKSLGIKEL